MTRPAASSARPRLTTSFVALAAVATWTTVARADCPASEAACVLQKEGAEALAAKDYDKARAKFDASLANTRSARAYLGRAQAVAGLGDVAGAYDDIMEAKRMSDAEVAAAPNDVEMHGRSERIKYLAGEMRAKVGLVRLQLPESIDSSRLVSVQRKSEGNVADPLGRPVAVAPDDQTLVAFLDDGTRIEFVVEVPAGREATFVIPINGGTGVTIHRPKPEPKPQRPHDPADDLPDNPGTWRVRVAAATVPSQTINGGLGLGGFVGVERRTSDRTLVEARFGVVQHVGASDTDPVDGAMRNLNALEGMVLVGGRGYVTKRVYLFGEVGLLNISESVREPTVMTLGANFDSGNNLMAITLGAGVDYDRFELETAMLFAYDTSNVGSSPRLLVSLGVRLWP